MILVDSSVWIDFLRGRETWQTEQLDRLFDSEILAIGDLNLTEVLQGCPTQREFDQVQRLFDRLHFVALGGSDVAVAAARNYRKLRSLGVTVRGTIDVVLATRCLVSGYHLLHCDRDFEAFEQHLGLQCVAPTT